MSARVMKRALAFELLLLLMCAPYDAARDDASRNKIVVANDEELAACDAMCRGRGADFANQHLDRENGRCRGKCIFNQGFMKHLEKCCVEEIVKSVDPKGPDEKPAKPEVDAQPVTKTQPTVTIVDVQPVKKTQPAVTQVAPKVDVQPVTKTHPTKTLKIDVQPIKKPEINKEVIQETGSANESCPIVSMVDEFKKVLGCGNFGCAVQAAIKENTESCMVSEAVMKVVAPYTAGGFVKGAEDYLSGESKVLAVLSALGEPQWTGCHAGESNADGVPCVLSPNYLHMCGAGECSCESVSQKTREDIAKKAKAMGKRGPPMAGACGFLLMERVHSDLKVYPVKKASTFANAVLLQMLFAYHVALNKVGFVHKDVLSDNIALRCETKFSRFCEAPPAGTRINCLRFEAGGKLYCFDLKDTEGTVVVLIDFGLSKLGQDNVQVEWRAMNVLAHANLGIELQYGGATGKDVWLGAIKNTAEVFQEFEVDTVPPNAKIFGF